MLLHQDGTLKLWDFESGSELQSLDLRQLDETTSSEADKDKVSSVFHPVTLRLQHRFSLNLTCVASLKLHDDVAGWREIASEVLKMHSI